MTYGNLKLLVTGLLIGDNVLPKDDNVIKQLLEYSFSMVSDTAEALHLLTLNKDEEDIQRLRTTFFTLSFSLFKYFSSRFRHKGCIIINIFICY